MTASVTDLSLLWGADLRYTGTWTDANDDPVNLTGGSLSIVRADAAISGRISAAILSAASGTFTISMDWADAIGEPGTVAGFRVLFTAAGGVKTGLPPFRIVIG